MCSIYKTNYQLNSLVNAASKYIFNKDYVYDIVRSEKHSSDHRWLVIMKKQSKTNDQDEKFRTKKQLRSYQENCATRYLDVIYDDSNNGSLPVDYRLFPVDQGSLLIDSKGTYAIEVVDIINVDNPDIKEVHIDVFCSKTHVRNSYKVGSLVTSTLCDKDTTHKTRYQNRIRYYELISVAYYHNALLPVNYTGSWTTWHPNGKMKLQAYFKNGLRNDEWSSYYDNGINKAKYSYIDGERNGTFIGWHKNNRERIKCNYVYGERFGECTEWYDNGVKKSVYYFFRDIKEGWSKEYDGKGIRIKKTYYLKGRIVTTKLFNVEFNTNTNTNINKQM
jgi:antitoxin component YwqK of YwqJK toxin-antitoxin module